MTAYVAPPGPAKEKIYTPLTWIQGNANTPAILSDTPASEPSPEWNEDSQRTEADWNDGDFTDSTWTPQDEPEHVPNEPEVASFTPVLPRILAAVSKVISVAPTTTSTSIDITAAIAAPTEITLATAPVVDAGELESAATHLSLSMTSTLLSLTMASILAIVFSM